MKAPFMGTPSCVRPPADAASLCRAERRSARNGRAPLAPTRPWPGQALALRSVQQCSVPTAGGHVIPAKPALREALGKARRQPA
jgi:hypothetical protein